jgi:hypothetical protein
MNDAMSMGIHRLWKDTLVASLKPGSAKVGRVTRCIDVAGGTGDIALRILDYAREHKADRDLTVDVVDINPDMLKEGQKRFRKTMYHASERIYSIHTRYTCPFVRPSSPSRVPCRQCATAGTREIPRQYLRPIYHRIRHTKLYVNTRRN